MNELETLARKATLTDKTILVVEDSEDNRILAMHFLRNGGFHPICVGDGAEALAYLSAHDAPDAILLDLRMPNIDGWEFLEAQRRDQRIAAIPVVIYSCEVHLRGERGLSPNVVSCVCKTDGSAALLKAVNSAVATFSGNFRH